MSQQGKVSSLRELNLISKIQLPPSGCPVTFTGLSTHKINVFFFKIKQVNYILNKIHGVTSLMMSSQQSAHETVPSMAGHWANAHENRSWRQHSMSERLMWEMTTPVGTGENAGTQGHSDIHTGGQHGTATVGRLRDCTQNCTSTIWLTSRTLERLSQINGNACWPAHKTPYTTFHSSYS